MNVRGLFATCLILGVAATLLVVSAPRACADYPDGGPCDSGTWWDGYCLVTWEGPPDGSENAPPGTVHLNAWFEGKTRITIGPDEPSSGSTSAGAKWCWQQTGSCNHCMEYHDIHDPSSDIDMQVEGQWRFECVPGETNHYGVEVCCEIG